MENQVSWHGTAPQCRAVCRLNSADRQELRSWKKVNDSYRDGFSDEIVEVGGKIRTSMVDVDIGNPARPQKFMKAPAGAVCQCSHCSKTAPRSGRICHHRQDPVCRDLCGVRLTENVRNDPTGDVLHQSQCQDRMLTAALPRQTTAQAIRR